MSFVKDHVLIVLGVVIILWGLVKVSPLILLKNNNFQLVKKGLL